MKEKVILKSSNGEYTTLTMFIDGYNSSTGKAYLYNKENVVAKLEHAAGEMLTYSINGINVLSDDRGRLLLNIKDYITANNKVVNILSGANQRISIIIQVLQGISPDSWFAMIADDDIKVAGVHVSGVYSLPNVMYKSQDFGVNTKWAVYGNDTANRSIAYFDSNGKIIERTNDSIEIADENGVYMGVSIVGNVNMIHYTFKDLDCDCKYILLQWLPLAGITTEEYIAGGDNYRYKRAVFEIANISVNNTETQELMIAGDGYTAYKYEDVVLTCRIKGLDPYSFAYYADICQSDKVNALLIGEDPEILQSDISFVDVITKDVELLQAGNDLRDFVFQIKYKHYGSY